MKRGGLTWKFIIIVHLGLWVANTVVPHSGWHIWHLYGEAGLYTFLELDGCRPSCCIVLPTKVCVVEVTHENHVLLTWSLLKQPKYCLFGLIILVLRLIAGAYCKILLGDNPSDLDSEALNRNSKVVVVECCAIKFFLTQWWLFLFLVFTAYPSITILLSCEMFHHVSVIPMIVCFEWVQSSSSSCLVPRLCALYTYTWGGCLLVLILGSS